MALLATAVLFSATENSRTAIAGTCASKCGPRPIQFTPGQLINVEVTNLTSSIVLLEKVQGTDAIPLYPGKTLYLERGGGTNPNFSAVFWDQTALPLRAIITQPQSKTLRIELRPGSRPPGDRSVYVRNDGRVAIF
jgi:hypothetical protein